MQIIQNNPYRTVGLLVGSTAREQTKQINRLKKYIEAEQEPQDDFSFPILGNLHRTLDSVEEAASKLNLDCDKINAALFWFWNGNPITDEAAFEALKSGEIETAYEIWDKLTTKTEVDGTKFWKTVTEKNYSAFHNCSILNIIKANDNLQNGIVANLYFLESDLVEKFVSSVADKTHKISKKELQLLFLNQLNSDIEANKKTSLTNFLDILNKQEFVAKPDFMKGFIQKPIEQIEQKIEVAKNKRKASKANAANAGQELFIATATELNQLKSVVGSEDIKYTSIADKVASEILQCSIDYFNDSQKTNRAVDYAETAMKLAKQAESIAIGNLTKSRVEDSINTLTEMKDKELLQAIDLLKSVKDAYETNKAKINKEVLGVRLGFNQSINWTKVNQMIEQSLDWDKVVDLILKTIPQKNIEKIKNTNKSSQLNEYKTLADFVISKLNFSQVNKVKYICYWKTENTVSNVELTVKSLPSWAKWCLGLAIILLIVGLIWGEEGLAVMFGISAFLGVMFLIGWLQSL